MTKKPDDSPITTWRDNRHALLPPDADKDTKSRMGAFLDWLAERGRGWHQPDLAAYRDYLLKDRPAPLQPETVKAHLATIRGRYAAILRDNDLRGWLYAVAPPTLVTLADRKAFVDETLVRLQNAVHPASAPVNVIGRQDEADADHLRLQPHQVRALIRAPGIITRHGLRDTAIIALLACTGIREAELVALDVADLTQTLGGELALRVREGKGDKQRLVPYGALEWCVLYVKRWLESATIYDGAIFRGFYKGNRRVRANRISTRAVNQIFHRYPIPVGGELVVVQPHDLRRTYARNAYLAGMDVERIRQNLGHVSLNTTQSYIGTLDAADRQPPSMFAPPHDLRTI